MAAIDVVNRVLREFRRYTGDGLPGEPVNAPLPVGDPQSGPHNPKKSELRAALLAPLEDADQSVVEAEAAAARAEAARDDIEEKWLGAHPDDASATAAAGGSPIVGAEYWNTTLGKRKTWDGAVWQENDVALNDGAVTEPKLADEAVSERAMANGAATLAKIGDDAKADFRRVGPSLSEPVRCVWRSEGAITFQHIAELAMCGSFHQGHWEKATAPIFATPAPLTNAGLTYASVGNGISTQGDLLYENWCSVNVWENLWFVADDGDAVGRYKFTPSLRAGSIAGNVITLNACGENSHPTYAGASPKSFQWANDALVGVRVLVVTETVESRANTWCGRTALITANTNSTITLDSIGGIGPGDFLVLLPNTDHCVWLCDAYFEDNSINSPPAPMISLRSIGAAGIGRRVSRGVNLANNMPPAGVVVSTPGNRVPYAGNVSPLARSIIAYISFTMAASSSGTYAINCSMDTANHDMATAYDGKFQTTTGQTKVESQLILAGSYGPYFYFKNAGSNIANVTNQQVLCYGFEY